MTSDEAVRVSDTSDSRDVPAYRSVPVRKILQGAGATAVLVFGLSACGGSAESAGVVDESPSSTTQDAGFISADEDPDDPAPEAIAAADLEADADIETDAETEADIDTEADVDVVDEVDEEEDSNPIGVDSPPSPPAAEGNHSVFSNGKLFVRGTVASEEIAEAVVVAAEQVLGAGNVIDEYEIDPSADVAPEEASTVYVEDSVLFEPGSAEISEDSAPTLGLLPLLMAIQPDVTIWAVGHTDSVGSAESNLELSQARVDAVREWVVGRGGDPDRFFATGEGETRPIADNETDSGRAQNRRVEFIIEGFDIGIDG